MKDSQTGQVIAKPVRFIDKPALHSFADQHVEPATAVYTGNVSAYAGIPVCTARVST